MVEPSAASAAAESKPEHLLELQGLSARYGSLVAIREVEMTVDAGEVVTLLGANGAGKSTTLGAIVGLVTKCGGKVRFEGRDISRLSTEAVVASGITLVPEGRRIFANLSVEDNLRLGGATLPAGEYAAARDEVVDLFPLVGNRSRTLAGLLSGGEQQQVAIARALMSRPKLLLLDEPSLGLAPVIVAAVFELIAQLKSRGITMLLVEQNVERAMEIADRAYVLSTGHITMAGDQLSVAEIEDTYLGLTSSRSGDDA